MKNQTTKLWFALAVGLFGYIWLHQHRHAHDELLTGKLFPGLQALEVSEIHFTPASGKEFSLVHTNNLWRVQKPFVYPAQSAAISSWLSALEKLSATHLAEAELTSGKNSETNFGFATPQATIDLTAGATQWHFVVGNKTAPGDQVFVKIGGQNGAFVTEASWLAQLPTSVESWRDLMLIGAMENCDWIVITNGAKTIELRREANNNKLWRMVQPLATRADSSRIAIALQSLLAAQTTRFVTDDPKADLTTYGLEPATADLCFGRGSNVLASVHAGKVFADDTNQIYVRRDAFNSVALAAKAAFANWKGEVDGWRDAHLLDLHSAVSEIEVRGTDTNFTLIYNGENDWRVAGEKFSVDTESVVSFVKLLLSWRASEFVKDVTTQADLEKYGLAQTSRHVVFRGRVGDTNSTVAEILFGNLETNRVFVKRGDEGSVYALAIKDFNRLAVEGWQFRSRKVWSFSETNVASITLKQSSQTRVLLRNGTNSWSLAPGSQGVIDPLAIEETVHRLGELMAEGWVARNNASPETFGFNPNNLQLTVELKTAEKLTLNFGNSVPQTQTVFAEVTLDGEHWAFVFPPGLAPFVAAHLTIPASTP